MRHRKLWRYRWRLLGWSVFLLTIAAATVGLHAIMPPVPRWTMDEGPLAVFQVADGFFAAFPRDKGAANGPLILRDAATGRDVQRFLTGVAKFEDSSYTEDGGTFVALVKGDTPGTVRIRGVDLEARREWQADLAIGPFGSVAFSPDCKVIAFRVADDIDFRIPPSDDLEGRHVLVDTATGRKIAELPGKPNQVHFSERAGCLAASYHDEDNNDWIRVVNTATGKVAEVEDARFIAVAPDARWIIADRGEEGVWLWDVEQARWHALLEGATVPLAGGRINMNNMLNELWVDVSNYVVTSRYSLRGARRARRVRFSPDGSLRYSLMISDLRASVDGWLDGGRVQGRHFTPDSRSILWPVYPGTGQSEWAFYNAQTGKPRWKQSLADFPGGHQYTPDSQYIVRVGTGGSNAEVVDTTTGETIRTLPLDGISGASIRITRQGRLLVAAGTPPEQEPNWLLAKLRDWLAPPHDIAPMVIRVFDLETGEAIHEISIDECDENWLTDDAQTLITVSSQNNDEGVIATTIRGWDVPPAKPLRWPHGLPLACGLALVALYSVWARVRRTRGRLASA
jgi:hypothetical protein